MIWLRLDKGQMALVALSAGFLIAAIAVLLLSTPTLPLAESEALEVAATRPEAQWCACSSSS